ncbi:MAG: tyrosine-type recombinase/integrase [Acidobacteria bacterium]|nr:tyrosine-type recombinase/integrase [Acidobacteriota bacterium]
MLISQTDCDLNRSFERGHATRVGEPLAAYFEAARGAFSRNTERALRSDLQIFASWCRRHFRAAFPADAAAVVAFIDEMARVKTPATVRRYVSSIATSHKALRQPNPVDSAAVRFALKRMHRCRGRRQAQVLGLTWPLRNRLIEAGGDRLIDARDRALLAVGYDTLLRRTELVSLQVLDVLEEIDGTATLLVRSGKTDPDGRGATLYLARDTVQFVKTWLELAGVDGGRLFRSVRKDGTVGEKLDASQVPRIYKRMARRAGLPGDVADALAGHSTRVGAVQDMIACGIELPAILQSGRWKTTRMVQRYGERLLARRSGAAQLAERQKR